jgi:hypothetical protein
MLGDLAWPPCGAGIEPKICFDAQFQHLASSPVYIQTQFESGIGLSCTCCTVICFNFLAAINKASRSLTTLTTVQRPATHEHLNYRAVEMRPSDDGAADVSAAVGRGAESIRRRVALGQGSSRGLWEDRITGHLRGEKPPVRRIVEASNLRQFIGLLRIDRSIGHIGR